MHKHFMRFSEIEKGILIFEARKESQQKSVTV